MKHTNFLQEFFTSDLIQVKLSIFESLEINDMAESIKKICKDNVCR